MSGGVHLTNQSRSKEKMSHRPAGGLKSRNVKNVSAPKAEPRPNKMNVKGVSQIGQAIGNHATEGKRILKNVPQRVYDGHGYSPPVGPTDNVAAVGVGGGRKIYSKGSQGGLQTRQCRRVGVLTPNQQH
jgi:hypothetical protein